MVLQTEEPGFECTPVWLGPRLLHTADAWWWWRKYILQLPAPEILVPNKAVIRAHFCTRMAVWPNTDNTVLIGLISSNGEKAILDEVHSLNQWCQLTASHSAPVILTRSWWTLGVSSLAHTTLSKSNGSQFGGVYLWWPPLVNIQTQFSKSSPWESQPGLVIALCWTAKLYRDCWTHSSEHICEADLSSLQDMYCTSDDAGAELPVSARTKPTLEATSWGWSPENTSAVTQWELPFPKGLLLPFMNSFYVGVDHFAFHCRL